MTNKRKRPVVLTSLRRDTKRAVEELAEAVPGASESSIVREAVERGLPLILDDLRRRAREGAERIGAIERAPEPGREEGCGGEEGTIRPTSRRLRRVA